MLISRKTKKAMLMAAALIAMPAALYAGDMTPSYKIFGEVHMGVDLVDNGTDSELQINDHVNKLGIKGDAELNSNLKVIYQAEVELALADTTNGASVIRSGRNSYIGLEGSYGALLIGRHDTPYKVSYGKLDVFGDTPGDVAGIIGRTYSGKNLENRDANMILYKSPDFNNFAFQVAYDTAESEVGETGAGITGTGEDCMTANLSYQNEAFFAGLGYLNWTKDSGAGVSSDWDGLRLALGYNSSFGNFGAIYENIDSSVLADTRSAWALSYALPINSNTFKLQYAVADDSDAAVGFSDGATQLSLGVDHQFTKKTKAYVMYTTMDADFTAGGTSGYKLGNGGRAPQLNPAGTGTETSQSVSVFSVGIDHKF